MITAAESPAGSRHRTPLFGTVESLRRECVDTGAARHGFCPARLLDDGAVRGVWGFRGELAEPKARFCQATLYVPTLHIGEP